MVQKPQTIDQIKQAVLSQINIISEYQEMGVRLAGSGAPNARGWVLVYSPYKTEKKPSCGIYLGNTNTYRGYLVAFNRAGSSGKMVWTSSLFDSARDLHPQLSGCNFIEILEFYAKKLNIDFSAKKIKKNSKSKKTGIIESTYDYRDEKGKLIFQAVRFRDPKSFKQRQPASSDESDDKWIWNLQDIEIIPYNLQEIIKPENEIIYIVEGEKDVDNLKAIGITATCCPMGAGKWWPNVNKYFEGKHVIAIPDNDIPGQDHAERVYRELSPVAQSIKIIQLPELPEKGDVSDWLESGGQMDDLIALVNQSPEKKQYDDEVSLLNKKHIAIMIAGKFVVMNEEINPVSKRIETTFSSVNDFRNRYLNRMVLNPKFGEYGQKKEITAAELWLKSINRRECDQIVFDPDDNNKGLYSNCYNLWRGLATQSIKGDWSLYRDHIFSNIASGNQSHYNWIISWMARIVQNPGGKRPGTSIVLRGKQGTGKGVFLTNFGKLFGNHFLHINNQSQLVGRFNNLFKDALFVFVDEGFWAGDKSVEGIVRGMITEDILIVEPKGKDSFMVKNHINLAMASNNEWVVPAGMEERRFFVIDVADNCMQNISYFQKISKQMNNGGHEALLYDLLRWDYENEADIKKVPRTSALFDQILSSMNDVQKFWYEKIRDMKVSKKNNDWDGEIYCAELYNDYVEHSKMLGFKNIRIDRQFGKALRQLCPSLRRRRKTMEISGKQEWYYIIPDFAECVYHFEKAVEMEMDWDRDDVYDGR